MIDEKAWEVVRDWVAPARWDQVRDYIEIYESAKSPAQPDVERVAGAIFGASKLRERESSCPAIVRQAIFWAKGYIDGNRKFKTGLPPTENNPVDKAAQYLTDVEVQEDK